MNIFSQYMAYLRDNPQRYWFKRKLYGWGWTPALWQGWVVILVFVLLMSASVVHITLSAKAGLPFSAVRGDFVRIFGLILLLIFVCYKTGEPPRWQWGLPKGE